MTNEVPDEWEDVKNDLLGSSGSIPDHLMDDTEFCEWLDNEILICNCCGWWVETGDTQEDENGEIICDDCAEEALDREAEEVLKVLDGMVPCKFQTTLAGQPLGLLIYSEDRSTVRATMTDWMMIYEMLNALGLSISNLHGIKFYAMARLKDDGTLEVGQLLGELDW